MERYTTDAVGFIRYLIDELGPASDELFSKAEQGDLVIELPMIAASETLYRIQRGHPAKGVELPGTAEDVVLGLRSFLPVTLVETTVDDLEHVAVARGTFSLHDAMIVASHRTRDTQAVITTDTTIDDEGIPVVW
ncbi:MAG: type II toxin-antitoxin system VapC family toxin [Halorientalis sp.]